MIRTLLNAVRISDGADTAAEDVVTAVQSISVETLDTDLQRIWELILPSIKALAGAILIFIIGIIVIRLLKRAIKRGFDKNDKIDKTVESFALSAIDISLKILLILAVIATLGVNITSLVAVFGAVSFAIGLALQGSLENFAGGVMLLIFKPFKVGDYIEVDGKAGIVNGMSIISTKLNTFDNKMIIIPNSKTSSSTLVNYSTNPLRRIDLVVGVDYDSDIDKTRQVVKEVIDSNDMFLQDPEPIIGVTELGDSSVNFSVLVWVEGKDYLPGKILLNEHIKKALDKNNIDIPYPHMTIVNK